MEDTYMWYQANMVLNAEGLQLVHLCWTRRQRNGAVCPHYLPLGIYSSVKSCVNHAMPYSVKIPWFIESDDIFFYLHMVNLTENLQVRSSNSTVERQTPCDGWQQGKPPYARHRALESWCEGWKSIGKSVAERSTHTTRGTSQVS